MALSMFGSLNGCILSFPREYYALAYDGLFFKSFGKLHPKYRTPSMAIISQMVISVIAQLGAQPRAAVLGRGRVEVLVDAVADALAGERVLLGQDARA